MNLIYDCIGAHLNGENRQPVEVLKEIGISWLRWEPQPIADQIKLHNCYGVPDNLPEFIRISK